MLVCFFLCLKIFEIQGSRKTRSEDVITSTSTTYTTSSTTWMPEYNIEEWEWAEWGAMEDIFEGDISLDLDITETQEEMVGNFKKHFGDRSQLPNALFYDEAALDKYLKSGNFFNSTTEFIEKLNPPVYTETETSLMKIMKMYRSGKKKNDIKKMVANWEKDLGITNNDSPSMENLRHKRHFKRKSNIGFHSFPYEKVRKDSKRQSNQNFVIRRGSKGLQEDLVHLCSYTLRKVDYGENVTPRYGFSIECVDGDKQCLSGYGQCTQRVQYTIFQRQNPRTKKYKAYQQEVKTGCVCECFRNSPVSSIV